MNHLDTAELRERIRGALSLAEVMGHDGVELRRAGPHKHTCCCPFHAEKSASFVVGGKVADRGHCFGCGWDGDIFAYWMARRDVDFPKCLIELADMAGLQVPHEMREPGYKASTPRPLPQRSPDRLESSDSVKPSLPPMRGLRPEECAQLASVRGLSINAIRHAAFVERRVGFSMWPLYETSSDQHPASSIQREWLARSQGAWPSWVVTDATRNVAEFRRLDGLKYPRHDGGEIKAWSTAGKNWPLGAGQIGHRTNVLLVEGGPDMLAAYDFLLWWRMIDKVAVVCMLGASNSIRQEARPAFKGKRVRIMQDADLPKDDENPRKRRIPAAEACARWTRELCEAGAAVESYCVGPIHDPVDVVRWGAGEILAAEIGVLHPGLSKPDGSPVKDLNDLALCGEDVTCGAQVREAFCVWDF